MKAKTRNTFDRTEIPPVSLSKMLDKNAFDRSNLPEEVLNNLGKYKPKNNWIVDLFKLKEKLSIDEIIIARYNLYGEIAARKNIYAKLVGLINNKRIVRQATDVYVAAFPPRLLREGE